MAGQSRQWNCDIAEPSGADAMEREGVDDNIKQRPMGLLPNQTLIQRNHTEWNVIRQRPVGLPTTQHTMSTKAMQLKSCRQLQRLRA